MSTTNDHPGPPAPTDGPDPYAVLGVPQDATPAQVTAAFRRLARALHPDTRSGPTGPPGLDDVLAAYETLRDPARRAAHDRGRTRAAAATDAPTPSTKSTPSRQPAGRPAAPDLVAGPPRWHSAEAPPPAAPPLFRAGPVVQIRGPAR